MRYNYTNGISVERKISIPAIIAAAATAGLLALITLIQTTYAASTDVVTESEVTRQAENTPPTDNWVIYTRAGTPATAAVFVDEPATTPLGTGSLKLTTTTGSEKVYGFNYDHFGKELADVDSIGYSTYRLEGSLQQVTALNVQVDYNGDAPGGFTTLVFEPVYNTDQGAVVSGEWQDWIASGTGIWWSTQPINGQCAGATSTCDKTWTEIVANNPDATVIAAGVNQGSGNPGLTTYVDAFTFDETTYDFEESVTAPLAPAPTVLGWTSPTTACGGSTTNTTITANWEDVEEADSYIYTVTTPGTHNETNPYTEPVSVSEFAGSFNEGYGVYTYSVQSVNKDGVVSSPSAKCSITFQPQAAVNKDQCKNEGWRMFAANYKNQGQCVSSVVSNRS